VTAVRVTPGNDGGVLGENPGMTTEHDPSPIHGLLPTAATPPRRRRRWPWIAAAVVLAAGIGAGAVVLIDHVAQPNVPTFTVTGEITAPATLDGNGGCDATDGYSDITSGAAVIVQGPQGQTVATGALQSGQISDSETCQFPFTVPSVPGDLSSYSVTISHRGTQVLTPAAAHQPVDLTLG
jgi:hypothetical protein